MAKIKLPELTPAHREFNRRTAQAQDRTAKHVIPLFATDEDQEDYTLGSGVLLNIDQEHFLLSAAHVFDENKNPKHPTDIRLAGKNKLIPISGLAITSQRPPTGRQDDKIDIAIVPLNQDLASELSYFTFLDITQVDPSDKPYVQSLYTFTGYPSTKQKPPKNGTLTIEPVRYTSGPLPSDQYPKGYDLGPHHGIDYSKKKMIARTGQVQLPPNPQGISGGGVFRLGTYDEIKNGKNKETLVGIAIEAHPNCLIATNISFALEMIREYFPALDALIPHSTYLKINAQRRTQVTTTTGS